MTKIESVAPAGPEDTPPWKTELFRRPLVEVRRGLSLAYDAPSEDSSTIALCAPSGKYVDIRFSTLPETSAGSEVTKQLGSIHGYATAGTSKIILPTKPDANCPPYDFLVYVEWVHTIDSSRTFDTAGADMILMPDGCRMEVGFMEIRGTFKYFKEYWIIPSDRETDLPCIVAELNTSDLAGGAGAGAVHGMAIRIGDFCQGIFQTETEFLYERWENKGTDGWVRDARSNTLETASSASGILPCLRLTEGPVELGNSIKLDGKVWDITEAIY